MSEIESQDQMPVDDGVDDDEYDDFCVDCGDEFHYDDIGGYNPPCSCGMHCRRCHEIAEGLYDDEYERDEDGYPDNFDDLGENDPRSGNWVP